MTQYKVLYTPSDLRSGPPNKIALQTAGRIAGWGGAAGGGRSGDPL